MHFLNALPVMFFLLICVSPLNAAENRLLENSKDMTWTLSDAMDDMRSPVAMDFDQYGNLYVCDFKMNQIVKVSPQGEVLFSFGRTGQGPGEFVLLYDVAVDKKNDRVWVIDQVGRSLSHYNLSGTLIAEHTLNMMPFSLATLSDGKIVVGGSGSTNLQVLNEDGQVLKQFGHDGSQEMIAPLEEQIYRGLNLTTDDTDTIFVSYIKAPIIEAYSPEGKQLWRTERPWTDQSSEPQKPKLTHEGMSFAAAIYHLDLIRYEDLLLVSTHKDEQALIKLEPKSGKYLGFERWPYRVRAMAKAPNQLLMLESLEGVIHAYGADSTRPVSVSVHPDYSNRYVLANSLESKHSKESKTSNSNTSHCGTAGSSTKAENGCTCGSGKGGSCNAGCCGGGE